jgi:hypothetical protein
MKLPLYIRARSRLMTRFIPIAKALIPAAVLASLAPLSAPGYNLTGSVLKKAATWTQISKPLAIVSSPGTKSVVERIPKSYLAWSFATRADGTQVISGPNGIIWSGRLKLYGGPYVPNLHPPASTQPPYNYYFGLPNGKPLTLPPNLFKSLPHLNTPPNLNGPPNTKGLPNLTIPPSSAH